VTDKKIIVLYALNEIRVHFINVFYIFSWKMFIFYSVITNTYGKRKLFCNFLLRNDEGYFISEKCNNVLVEMIAMENI